MVYLSVQHPEEGALTVCPASVVCVLLHMEAEADLCLPEALGWRGSGCG